MRAPFSRLRLRTSLRLSYQLALVTFAPLLFFGLLSVSVSAYALYRIPRDLALERHAALTQIAATKIANYLAEQLRLLGTLSREIAPQAGVVRTPQERLDQYTNLLSVFDGGVVVLDADGAVLAATSAARTLESNPFASRAYFQQLKAEQRTVFATVFTDQPQKVAAVIIAVPMWNSAGEFVGALAGEFHLQHEFWTGGTLALQQADADRRISLVDATGTLIYPVDAEGLGQKLRDLPAVWQLVTSGEARSVIYTPPGQRAPMVAAYAPIAGAPWGLLMEEPLRALLAPIVPFQWATGGLLLLGLLVALVALLLNVRRVTHPLALLTTEAERITAGQPFRPLTPAGPPDLHTLIAIFNEMVERLETQRIALREYAREVLRGQEDERQRISRELHDETVQGLVGLVQRIELCRNALAAGATEDVARRLTELDALAHTALNDVRRMSRNLRPRMLEDLGLPAALEALCEDMAQQLSATRVHCEIVGTPVRLPDALELTAFRVTQEALNNVRQHAQCASRVNVTLFFEAWGLLVLIEDDGPGFTLQTPETLIRAGHLGLAGMYERAQLFDGELQIATAPGEGTRVSLRLPYPQDGTEHAGIQRRRDADEELPKNPFHDHGVPIYDRALDASLAGYADGGIRKEQFILDIATGVDQVIERYKKRGWTTHEALQEKIRRAIDAYLFEVKQRPDLPLKGAEIDVIGTAVLAAAIAREQSPLGVSHGAGRSGD